jgi:hypothetical protein
MAGAKFIIIVNGKVYKWEYHSNYTLDGFGIKLINQINPDLINYIKNLPEDFTQDYEFFGNMNQLKALGSEINDYEISDEYYEMLYSYTIDFDSKILSIWCKDTRIGCLIDFDSDMHLQLQKLISLEKKLI